MKSKMTNCGTCKQAVAKTAKKCPHCGAVYGNAATGLIVGLGWLLAILGVVLIVGGPYNVIGICMIVVGAGLGLGGEAFKKPQRGG